MKFWLIAPAGVLLFGLVACSTSNDNKPGTGGSSTGTGGSNTGGSTGDGGTTNTGGSTGTGGDATGGNAGTGGSAGGATGGAGGSTNDASAGTGGGTPDASGGTGGSAGNDAAAPLTITSSDVGNFNNAFLMTSCTSAGTGFDCPNTAAGQTGCPQTAWVPPDGIPASEVTGTTYSEVFNVAGGDPSRIYAVTVRVRGQVEPRTYTGGQLLVAGATGTGQADPNGTNNLLYIGGRPGTTRVDYNVFMLTLAPPATSAPIPGRDGGLEPTFYAFNAVDSAHEGNHFNFQVDETFTFRVRPGYKVTLTNHDSNCIAIKNCGNGGPYNFANSGLCEAQARTIAGVTLPSTFRGNAVTNGGSQPFQTQFLNFQVTNIVAE